MSHHVVIDTAALYPHPSGLPFKHSLKKLAKEHLHKDIQDHAGGCHDSDAGMYIYYTVVDYSI